MTSSTRFIIFSAASFNFFASVASNTASEGGIASHMISSTARRISLHFFSISFNAVARSILLLLLLLLRLLINGTTNAFKNVNVHSIVAFAFLKRSLSTSLISSRMISSPKSSCTISPSLRCSPSSSPSSNISSISRFASLINRQCAIKAFPTASFPSFGIFSAVLHCSQTLAVKLRTLSFFIPTESIKLALAFNTESPIDFTCFL
mmetsp:Transcript_7781/g.23165  ORF Transcript_7781/g.23165 Transcript_7781/m.23165 type:complete len:206 (+) Transcript_7781:1349-1966(+)